MIKNSHQYQLPMQLFQSKLLLFSSVLLFVAYSGCSAQVKKHVSKNSVYTFAQPDKDGIGKIYMGREIAQIMGAAGAAWLERSNRQEEEHAQQAIDSLPLQANSIVADIGAGTGYYTFSIATKITAGKIYAVEVQDYMLSQLKNKKDSLHLNNVQIVKGSDTTINLPGNSIDLAIMVDVYHELGYPHEILQALYKALKPSGKLLLLEYRAEDASIPIKPLHKLSVQQANKELGANGFILYQRQEFLPIQHYLLYTKAAK